VSTVLEPEKYIDGCIDVFLSKMAKYAAENGQLSWPPGSNGASHAIHTHNLITW
jgi:hypothetical protein